jgi:hypothetical protein
VPKVLEEEVDAFGGNMTKLNKDQPDYIGIAPSARSGQQHYPPGAVTMMITGSADNGRP